MRLKKEVNKIQELSNYWDANSYAFIKYDNLKRDGKLVPYVAHPIRIKSILRAFGYNEYEHKELMISALLHDVLKETDTRLEEIERLFGSKVAVIVNELTQPEEIEKEEWLENFKYFSREARIIKIADRIDNLLDMDVWDKEKQISYLKQSKIILKSCGDANKELAEILKNIFKIKYQNFC